MGIVVDAASGEPKMTRVCTSPAGGCGAVLGVPRCRYCMMDAQTGAAPVVAEPVVAAAAVAEAAPAVVAEAAPAPVAPAAKAPEAAKPAAAAAAKPAARPAPSNKPNAGGARQGQNKPQNNAPRQPPKPSKADLARIEPDKDAPAPRPVSILSDEELAVREQEAQRQKKLREAQQKQKELERNMVADTLKRLRGETLGQLEQAIESLDIYAKETVKATFTEQAHLLKAAIDEKLLPAPSADPARVKAEMAKLAPVRQAANAERVDHKAWAKCIVARHEAGDRVRPISLRFAHEALGMKRGEA